MDSGELFDFDYEGLTDPARMDELRAFLSTAVSGGSVPSAGVGVARQ